MWPNHIHSRLDPFVTVCLISIEAPRIIECFLFRHTCHAGVAMLKVRWLVSSALMRQPGQLLKSIILVPRKCTLLFWTWPLAYLCAQRDLCSSWYVTSFLSHVFVYACVYVLTSYRFVFKWLRVTAYGTRICIRCAQYQRVIASFCYVSR